MAFLLRTKPSKIRCLPNQLERSYHQILAPWLPRSTSLHLEIPVQDRSYSVVDRRSLFDFRSVRFFAAPVQAKPKLEEKDSSGPRLNEKINADIVRLVTDEGHFVVSKMEALQRANALKLDLVEVDRTAKPPVCKIMDYHKEKYVQQMKEKDRVKSKSEVTLRKGACKEVRFSIKTEQKDLEMKANTVKRLMERGYRVKCMAMGTEDQELGGLLSRLCALIEDVSIVESGPLVEKKQAYAIVRHIKFGPSKKGGSTKKALKVAGARSPEIQHLSDSKSSSLIEDAELADGSGVETDDELPMSLPVEEKPMVMENRYKRDLQRNLNAAGERERMRSFPQSPDRKPEFWSNSSPPFEGPRLSANKGTMPPVTVNWYERDPQRNPDHVGPRESTRPSPQYPERRSEFQPSFSPPYERNVQGQSKSQANTFEGNGGSVKNRYKQGNNFDPTRRPRPREGLPGPYSYGHRQSGVNDSGRGRLDDSGRRA